MIKKISAVLLLLVFLSTPVFAQSSQEITLKNGFNFLSFTTAVSLTPQQFKDLNSAVEDIYLFSAAAGSFLSLKDGTLSSLAAGKGYIFKSLSAANIKVSVSGGSVTTIDNVKLLTGFNLVGFSIAPAGKTFEQLMTANTIIKGMYKWSSAAGSFISVVRNSQGTIEKLDGADPSIKAGESYFINLYADSTLNYNDSQITFTPSTYTIIPVDDVPAVALTEIPLPERAAGAGNISGTISMPSVSASGVSRAISIKSVSDIKVWVKNHPEINAVTDASGAFILKNVPAAVKDNGHTLEYEKIEDNNKFNGVIANIPVVESKQIDVSKYIGPLVIKKSAVIQGKIELADGLSPLGAEAYIAGISAMIAKADDDGTFSLLDVPAGTFNVVFQAYGYEISRQTVTLEANEIRQLTAVQLKKITPVTTTGTVDGYAQGSDGSPVAGALVSIISADRTVDIGVIASATGHYTFSNINAGKYKLIFIKDGYNGAEKEIDLTAGATVSHNQTMTKTAATPAAYNTFGLISGTVKDAATGAPVRNAVVLTVPPTRQFYTDYNGYFDFLIQPGTYTLKIQKTGYNEEQLSLTVQADKVSELEATLQAKTGTAAAASVTLNVTSLAVNAGDTLQLTATVKDASGNILSGKPIVWASTNSAAGEVTQSGLVTAKAEGACTVTASVEGKSAALSLTVKGASGPLVKSIKIYPETASLKLTESKQFVIFATYDDGTSKIIPSSMAAWTSSSASLMMLEKGSYIAFSVGAAVVTAKFNNFSASSSVTVIDSSDAEPPVISHSIPVYEADKDLIINAGASDNAAVAKVWLNFRTIGAADYIKVEMAKTTTGRYSYTIPAALVTGEGINYYIMAEDTKSPTSNKSTFPANGISSPVELKPAVILQSLTLSKASDKLSLFAAYDLSPIVAVAKYSDGTGKIVAVSWTLISGGGALSGKTYTAPAFGTQAAFKAVYSESGINVSADFVLTFDQTVPVATSVEVTMPSNVAEATQTAAVVLVKDQNGNAMSSGFTATFAITQGSSTVSTAGLVTAGPYSTTAASNAQVLTVTITAGTAILTQTANFTITADTTKPTIVSVSAVDNKNIVVTYGKKVSSSAVTVANYSLYNGSTGVVAAMVASGAAANQITASALFTDSTQKIVKITISAIGSGLSGYPAGGLDAVSYRLYVSNVQDTTSSANTIVASSNAQFTGTATPDQNKPVINAISYNKGSGTLIITCDKAVMNSLIYTNIKFNGTSLAGAVTNNAQTAGQENKISVTVASADKITIAALTGDITVTILADAISDSNGIKNEAASLVASLTVPPAMTSATYDEASNTLTMAFNQTLDLSTAALRDAFRTGSNIQLRSNEMSAFALDANDSVLTAANASSVGILLSDTNAARIEAIATHTEAKLIAAAGVFKNTNGDYNLKQDGSTVDYPAVTLTITKDSTKPAIQSITYSETTKLLVLTFNAAVSRTFTTTNVTFFTSKDDSALNKSLTGLTPTEVTDGTTLTYNLGTNDPNGVAAAFKAVDQGSTTADVDKYYVYAKVSADTFTKVGSTLKNDAVTAKADATTLAYTDNVGPYIDGAITVTNKVTISFTYNEKVNKTDAETLANYKVWLMSGSTKVSALTLNSVTMTDSTNASPAAYTKKTVQIVTASQTDNASYLLEVSNVKDLTGNAISTTDAALYSKSFTGSTTAAPAPKPVSAKIRDNGNQSLDTSDYIAVTFDRPVKINTGAASTEYVNLCFDLTVGGADFPATYAKSNVSMSTETADGDKVVLIKVDSAMVTGGTAITVGATKIDYITHGTSQATENIVWDKYSNVHANASGTPVVIESALGATTITEALLTDVDGSGTVNKGDTLKVTFSNPMYVVAGTIAATDVDLSVNNNLGTNATISTTMTTSVGSNTLTVTLGDSPTFTPADIKAGNNVSITDQFLKDSWGIKVASTVVKAVTTATVAAPYITKAEWVDVDGSGAGNSGDYVYTTFNVPVYLNSADDRTMWLAGGAALPTTNPTVTKVTSDPKVLRVQLGNTTTITPTVTTWEIDPAVVLSNITNFSGDKAVTAVTAGSTIQKIAVNSDTTAPTVTSVEFISDSKLKIVFSEAVNVSNYNTEANKMGLNINGDTAREANAVVLDSTDTTGKTAIFTLEAAATIAEQSNGIASTTTTGLKIVDDSSSVKKVNGITDIAGNKLAATLAGSSYIVISKDVTAPDATVLAYELSTKIGQLVFSNSANKVSENNTSAIAYGEMALLQVYAGASVPSESVTPTGIQAAYATSAVQNSDIITGLSATTVGYKVFYRLMDRAGNRTAWQESPNTVSASSF